MAGIAGINAGVQLYVDDADFEAIKRMVAGIKNGAGRVMSRALTRTIKSVRTALTRKLRPHLPGFKAAEIRKRISLRYATYTNWVATANISPKSMGPISLKKVPAMQTADGVSVHIGGKNGQMIRLKRAFIATGRGGGQYVFRRKTAGGTEVAVRHEMFRNAAGTGYREQTAFGPGVKLVGRLPIKRLGLPSLRELFYDSVGMLTELSQEASKDLSRQVLVQARVLVEQEAKKAAQKGVARG